MEEEEEEVFTTWDILDIEIEQAKTLRNAEKIYNFYIDKKPNEIHFEDRECTPMFFLLDAYFNILGRHYYAFFPYYSYEEDGKKLHNVRNFPDFEWVGKECKICKGEVEIYENAICTEDCNHVVHEYCLYDYIVEKVNSGTTFKDIQCPLEDCETNLFKLPSTD